MRLSQIHRSVMRSKRVFVKHKDGSVQMQLLCQPHCMTLSVSVRPVVACRLLTQEKFVKHLKLVEIFPAMRITGDADLRPRGHVSHNAVCDVTTA